MSRGHETANLRIMMIYGWQLNPYIEYVVQALLNRGADVTLVTQKALDVNIQHPGCSVHPLFPVTASTRLLHLLHLLLAECVALWRLAGLIRRLKPHIVHVVALRVPYLDWLLFLYLKWQRIKVVFTVHDTRSHNFAVDDVIVARVARHCDALFVHTRYSKQFIQQTWRIDPAKIFVVPHGGYESHVTRLPQDEVRSQLGYDKSDYILLFFGSIKPYKGLDFLIEAMRDVKPLVPEIKLIIAGKPSSSGLDTHYRGLIAESKLEGAITYENRYIQDDEAAQFFSACDIVVLPYLHIDQSGVLCLAYTYGKPVIVTQVGGLTEMVQEGTTGYGVPPGNTAALAAKISEAWTDKPHLQKMGDHAHQLLKVDYSWDRLAAMTLDVYRTLLAS